MNQLFKYYRVLGLKPDASAAQIKQAYHDLLWIWHPDRFENNPRVQKQAEEMVKDINNAYDHLKSNASVTHETSRATMTSGISRQYGQAHEQGKPEAQQSAGILPPVGAKFMLAALLALAMVAPAMYLLNLATDVVPALAPGEMILESLGRQFSEPLAQPEKSVLDKPGDGKRARPELCVKRNAKGILTYELCSSAALKRGYLQVSQAGALIETPAANPQSHAVAPRWPYDLTSADPFGERERTTKKTRSQRELFEKIKQSHADAQRQFDRHRVEHKQFSEEYQRRQELYNRGAVSRHDVMQAEDALAQAAIRLHNSQQWYAATESLFANARINDNTAPSP